MPKAILEFNLPEENEEFNLAIKGISYHCIIHDIKDKLRTKLKWEKLTEEQFDIYEEVQQWVFDAQEEHL
jgi:hypothetical protein